MKKLAVVTLVFAMGAFAQTHESFVQTHEHNPEHHKGMTMDAIDEMANAPIKEVGQAQFAAIAEIVDYLQNDPNTDWSTVNIDALRDHLVDMDNVTTKTTVETTVLDDTILFKVTGLGPVIESIRRMVTAHSAMLASDTGWNAVTENTEHGANMAITAKNGKDLARLRGLGFFGIMTVGAHHQMHHLMIATGQSPH